MSLLVIMSLLNGLTLAALLFITASGLTLSFSLMRVVNLTHGAFYMAGGFIGVSVIKVTGSWLLAMLAGGGVMAVLALLEEKYLLRWARGNDLIETLISLSVAIIIGDLVLVIWGGYPKTIEIPAMLSGILTIPVIDMVYPIFRIFMLGLAILIIVALWLFLRKPILGSPSGPVSIISRWCLLWESMSVGCLRLFFASPAFWPVSPALWAEPS